MAPHAARKHFQWPPRAHSVGSCPLSFGMVRNNSQDQLPLSKSASSPPSPHAPLGSSTALGINLCTTTSSSDPTDEPCTVSSSWTDSGMPDSTPTTSTFGDSSSSASNSDKLTSMGFLSKGDSSDRRLAGRLSGESLELARQEPTGSSFPAPQQAAAHTQRGSYFGCTEEPTEDALQEATGGSSSILSGQTVQASNTLLNRCNSWSAGGSPGSSSGIRKAPSGVRERLVALQKQQSAPEAADSSSTSSMTSSAPWLWKRNVVPCGEFRPSIGAYHLPSVSDFAANPLSAGSFRKVGHGSSKDAMQTKQDEPRTTNCPQNALRRSQSDTATAQLASSSKPLLIQQPARSNSGAHAEASNGSHGRQALLVNSNSSAQPVNTSCASAQQVGNYSGCGASAQPVEDNSCDAQLHIEPASTQSCLSPNSVRNRAAFFEGLIHSGTPTYITCTPDSVSAGLEPSPAFIQSNNPPSGMNIDQEFHEVQLVLRMPRWPANEQQMGAAQSEQHKHSLEATVAQLETLLAERDSEFQTVKDDLSRKMQECANLTQVIKELTDSRSRSVATKTTLSEQLADLRHEYMRVLRVAELSREVSKENVAKTVKAQKALTAVQEELAQSKHRNSLLTNKNKSLKLEVADLREKVNLLERLQLVRYSQESACMRTYQLAAFKESY